MNQTAFAEMRQLPAAESLGSLLNQIKPTLPVLLANLSTIGQIGVAYHASIEQLLVLLPPYVAQIQTYAPTLNPAGFPSGDFSLGLGDPQPCTVGFLPPSAWRNPSDTTTIDTPDNLYCKLPQDSPIAVRGARNYPCMEHPGKRAPTVELCDDPQGFQPLAQRNHVLGPYPLDPNLISQGVPMDSRVTPDANIYGPVDGTPLPAGVTSPPEGAQPGPQEAPRYPGSHPGTLLPGQPVYDEPPAGTTPGLPPAANPDTAPPMLQDQPLNSELPDVPGLGRVDQIPPMGDGTPGPGNAAPSAYNGANAPEPSVRVARYNPKNGEYMGSDGQLYHQANLATQPKSWQDLMPTA